MAEAAPPDYVVVGHMTRDLLPNNAHRAGGTATYSAVTAARLGCRVGVLTSAAPQDLQDTWRSPLVADVADAVAITSVPAARTTTFENLYAGGQREQYVRHVASPLTLDDLPNAWRGAAILHLGPVAAEVAEDPWAEAEAHLLGLTPQGWMRRWGADGRVWPVAWAGARTLGSCADAVVLSIEDVGYDQGRVCALAEMLPLLVVTLGRSGALVCWRGQQQRVPAFASQEVDLTGAGDVFAAAFLVGLSRGADPIEAARVGNAAASLAIEAPGLQGIPDLGTLERRLRCGRLVTA